MKKFSVITALPDIFESHLRNLPFSRALEREILAIDIVNLRDFATDSYGTIDDKPYGGGVGMVLKPEPIFDAVESIKKKDKKARVVLLSPKGEKFTQEKAREFTKGDHIIFISGRYEGVDARVEEIVDETISIGDYVLSGGELPSLVIMESVTRLLPSVLEKEDATEIESFSDGDNLEFPQYTRPEDYKGRKVPKVLLSGNHAEIEKWRKENSKK